MSQESILIWQINLDQYWKNIDQMAFAGILSQYWSILLFLNQRCKSDFKTWSTMINVGTKLIWEIGKVIIENKRWSTLFMVTVDQYLWHIDQIHDWNSILTQRWFNVDQRCVQKMTFLQLPWKFIKFPVNFKISL